MLLAVSENMIPGAGYGEKLRFLREYGYDGIELFPNICWSRYSRPQASHGRDGHCSAQHARSDARPAFRGPKRTPRADRAC